jgi:hypothetical protein
MDDREVDRYITKQIKELDITLYDIIGGPYVDPEPKNHYKPYAERIRPNRFSSQYWDLRLCELLTLGEFNPDRPYEKLAIPLKDLVRYWWDNIADQEAILEDALGDILIVYKDRMLPEGEEEPEHITYAFDRLLEGV